MRRPRCQVSMMMEKKPADTMGTKPPPANFRRLAANNGTSKDRKSASNASAFHGGHFQIVRVTSKKMIEVISMVPVTAIPYAAARPVELRKVTTNARQARARAQLIRGT